MTKVLSINQALKIWGFAIVAVAAMYYGGQASDSIAANQSASLAMRWLAVALAVACMLPWLGFIGWSVSMADEYYRHVALAGTAAAFVVDILVHVAFNVMQAARMVSWSDHLLELPAAMIVWVACVAISAAYYRLRL